MPKLVSTLVRAQISLLKPIWKKLDFCTQRKFQDALGGLGAKALVGGVRYEPAPFEKFDAAWAIPDCKDGKGLLYLHGGGYTSGSVTYAKGFGGLLAEQTQRETLCVGYRLAPEYPFPAALEDALDAYRLMLARFEARDIALAGESAGGGLCMALSIKLKELRLPLPGRIVAISPWTDLTLSGESVTANKDKDLLLDLNGLKESACLYAGEDTSLPLLSPLFGDLCGLPPVLAIAGAHELLLDDTLRLRDRIQACGGVCDTLIAEAMWHAYALYPVPEAREALERIKQFLAEEVRPDEDTV
jgi:epsilon-lactone hydrolase